MNEIHKDSTMLNRREKDINSYDSRESGSPNNKSKPYLRTSVDNNTSKDLFEIFMSKEPAQEE